MLREISLLIITTGMTMLKCDHECFQLYECWTMTTGIFNDHVHIHNFILLCTTLYFYKQNLKEWNL